MSLKNFLNRLPKHRYLIRSTDYRMPHIAWDLKSIQDVDKTKRVPKDIGDRIAKISVQGTRKVFDFITRYNEYNMTKRKWLNRAIFLETIAGIPGMIGGMVRHMKSLRTLEKDHGWIHHLLEEAENERMHLFFFLREKNPGLLFRFIIACTQFLFFSLHFFFYLIFPRYMHRFVGYLEEEAVHTYTVMLRHIDNGCLEGWKAKPAPNDFKIYYALPEEATYRDVVACIRADELAHREYNHLFSDIHGENEEIVHDKLEYLNTHLNKNVEDYYETKKNE